jgi:DNA polymerase III subunit gamma/tau
MPPQALSLVFFLLEEAIKNEPAIADEVRSLLNKADPTPEDWALLRANVRDKTYAQYVPASALAAAPTPPPATPAPEPAPAPVLTVLPEAAAVPPASAPDPTPTPTPAAAPDPTPEAQALPGSIYKR